MSVTKGDAQGLADRAVTPQAFIEAIERTTIQLFDLLVDPSDGFLERRMVLGDVLCIVFGRLVGLLAHHRGLLAEDWDTEKLLPMVQERTHDAFVVTRRDPRPGLDPYAFHPKWRNMVEPTPRVRGGIADAFRSLGEVACSVFGKDDRAIDYLGMAFERLYGTLPSLGRCEDGRLRRSIRRKDNGVFFTPPDVAKFLTERTLGPVLARSPSPGALLGLRVLDPAAGAGFFLLESLRLISAALSDALGQGEPQVSTAARRLVARQCLYGVDSDPLATELAKALIWMEIGDPTLPVSFLDDHIKCGDSLLGPASHGLGSSSRLAPPRETGRGRFDRTHSCLAPTEGRRSSGGPTVEPFCWECEFPDVFLRPDGERRDDAGFDVILTNPPWGALRSTLKEFYAHLDERVSNYQGAALRRFLEANGSSSASRPLQEYWEYHVHQEKAYARCLRDSGSYGAQSVKVDGKTTGGDADLYKYFMERSMQLVSPEGRMGLVAPAAFQRSEGATGLRRLYLRNGTFEDFIEFQNRKRVFPIHGMFRFLLLVYQRGRPGGIRGAHFGLSAVEEASRMVSDQSSGSVSLTPHLLRRVSRELMAIPEVRSRTELELFSKLHALHPTLGERVSQGWNASYMRELDMTNDSHAFRDATHLLNLGCREMDDGTWTHDTGETHLPVFEGRMVHQFDYAAKAYRGGQGRRAKWEPLSLIEKRIVSHYFVPEAHVVGHIRDAKPRAGFCDVTGHANERTVLAALIPSRSVCGNKVPVCCFDSDDQRIPLIWMAIANSFVVDWLVRRRISTTLNFFLLKQIPFPRVRPDSEVGCRLAAAASRLSELHLRSNSRCAEADRLTEMRWMAERAELRAQIDATVAALYELSPQDFSLVLADFPLLDRGQPSLPLGDSPEGANSGKTERRSTVTRDKALLQFFREIGQTPPARIGELPGIQVEGCVALERRVALAEEIGGIAYVPSELAVKIRRRHGPRRVLGLHPNPQTLSRGN